jgi:hypothetical protein
MSKTQYSSSSPYFDTPQTPWYLLPIKLRSLPPDSSDVLMVVDAKYQFRPDLLSYDLYGTPAYWWVFMLRNMSLIRDPIWDFKSGIEIYTPASSRLNTLLA